MTRLSFLAFLGSACLAPAGPATSPDPAEVKIGGYVGQRLDDCLAHNVKATNALALAEVFQSKAETNTWQTEFWGKWMQAAVPLARYSGDPALRQGIEASVKALLETQRPDGYIGNYTDAAQLDGPWDVWGRKYTMLGLLQAYDLTGDKATLAAAARVADHLMTQVGSGKRDLYKVGAYHGMASCSVLEPILWLHERTKDPKYLGFANYIASQMEEPEDSAKLITKALAGVDVGSRFPHPKSWWSWENGMKAYEMMSCYQGLLQFHQATGDQRALDAALAAARNIMATEVNAAGSGAAFECWYHGATRETEPAYHMMETCVTTTWLRFCESLLRQTGDPRFADQFEATFFNAYLAALSDDASTFSKYCPLDGQRGRGEDQCRMKTNCCIANGPRGFVALLETLVTAEADSISVNFYTESRAAIKLPATGNKVTIEQKTDYPAGDRVTLVVRPEREGPFTVKLRIPAWSTETLVSVNGQAVEGVKPGTYLALARAWKSGDTVELKLDLRGRARIKNNHLALFRGPVTLARDARFNDGNIHEVVGVLDSAKPVELTPVAAPNPGRWLAFTANLRLGVNLETDEGRTPRPVHFCDFASAGNTWKDDSAYRVWLPVPLNVMDAPYVPCNPPEK